MHNRSIRNTNSVFTIFGIVCLSIGVVAMTVGAGILGG
jgi:hypothetical protein